MQQNVGIVKGGTQVIECFLDQLSYRIFSTLLRGAQNKKASPKTNEKLCRGRGKTKGKLDHASSALPRPSFLLGLATGSKSDWLRDNFLKGGPTYVLLWGQTSGGGRVAGRG